LGKQVFDAYFASLNQVAPEPTDEAIMPPLDALDRWQKLGVINACQAVWAMWELGALSHDDLPFDEADVERWTLRPLIEGDAETIEASIGDEVLAHQIAEWQRRQGWRGSDIFRAHEKCSEEALREYRRWQAKRDLWRQETMAGTLPPRPKTPITANWRPDERRG
jgi:hypothetical protein